MRYGFVGLGHLGRPATSPYSLVARNRYSRPIELCPGIPGASRPGARLRLLEGARSPAREPRKIEFLHDRIEIRYVAMLPRNKIPLPLEGRAGYSPITARARTRGGKPRCSRRFTK